MAQQVKNLTAAFQVIEEAWAQSLGQWIEGSAAFNVGHSSGSVLNLAQGLTYAMGLAIKHINK